MTETLKILNVVQSVSASVVVGSHVWVEDPEVAWIDGVVAEVNGEEITVNCTSGKTVSFTLTYTFYTFLLFTLFKVNFSLSFKL